MLKQIFKGIKIVFKDSLSYKVALFASLVIGYLYYWLLYRVTTIPSMIQMTKDGEFGRYSYAYFVTYWITAIAIIILFGISIAVLFWLWRHSILSKLAGSSGGLGAFIGAFGASCPICGAFLLSLLGVSAGVSIFPLQGLEFNFLSLALIAGSTVFGVSRVNKAIDCGECNVVPSYTQSKRKWSNLINLPFDKILIFGLAAFFLLNQILISQAADSMGLAPKGNFIAQLFSTNKASALTIIAPKLNPDGKTTSLVEHPTITEVPGNPNTGDALADAKVVMLSTGKPFYAPDDISFDDPINAQNKWGGYENSIKLSSDLEARYQKLTSAMVCSYCCGGPTSVTLIKQCGCAHAKAVIGFYRYMLQTYGDKYSDEQLVGESHRWYAIWYPKGMLEDYLLATGKGDALPHKTHGGAGSDGRHGL